MKRPMNIPLILGMCKPFETEYRETHLISITDGQVHISEPGMEEVAPLSQWTLNQPRNCEKYPFYHEVWVDGVRFYTISESKYGLEGEERE